MFRFFSRNIKRDPTLFSLDHDIPLLSDPESLQSAANDFELEDRFNNPFSISFGDELPNSDPVLDIPLVDFTRTSALGSHSVLSDGPGELKPLNVDAYFPECSPCPQPPMEIPHPSRPPPTLPSDVLVDVESPIPSREAPCPCSEPSEDERIEPSSSSSSASSFDGVFFKKSANGNVKYWCALSHPGYCSIRNKSCGMSRLSTLEDFDKVIPQSMIDAAIPDTEYSSPFSRLTEEEVSNKDNNDFEVVQESDGNVVAQHVVEHVELNSRVPNVLENELDYNNDLDDRIDELLTRSKQDVLAEKDEEISVCKISDGDDVKEVEVTALQKKVLSHTHHLVGGVYLPRIPQVPVTNPGKSERKAGQTRAVKKQMLIRKSILDGNAMLAGAIDAAKELAVEFQEMAEMEEKERELENLYKVISVNDEIRFTFKKTAYVKQFLQGVVNLFFTDGGNYNWISDLQDGDKIILVIPAGCYPVVYLPKDVQKVVRPSSDLNRNVEPNREYSPCTVRFIIKRRNFCCSGRYSVKDWVREIDIQAFTSIRMAITQMKRKDDGFDACKQLTQTIFRSLSIDTSLMYRTYKNVDCSNFETKRPLVGNCVLDTALAAFIAHQNDLDYLSLGGPESRRGCTRLGICTMMSLVVCCLLSFVLVGGFLLMI